MSHTLKILLLEDNSADAELNVLTLKREGLEFESRWADSEEAFRRALQEFSPDLILSDFDLPGFDGFLAFDITRDQGLTTPFIFVSGTIGEDRAIQLLKRGAIDYVLKGNLIRLGPSVKRVLRDMEEKKARIKAEGELRDSEQRFRLFMQYLPGAAFIKNLDGRYAFLNRHAESAIGMKAGQALGLTDREIWPAEAAARMEKSDQDVIGQRSAQQITVSLPHADGIHHYLVEKFPILGPHGEPVSIAGIAVDLTEQVRAQAKIARLSRIREVMSGINAAIVRILDRQELFDAACRIAVEQGKFRMAWAGLVDSDAGSIKPVAWRGHEAGYLASISDRLTLDPANPAGQSVAARAVCANSATVSNDLANSPDAALIGQALYRGYRSCVALPLALNGAPVGVIQFYSAEAGFFDHEEMKLLQELTSDVAFALQHIANEEKLDYLAYYDNLTGLANRNLFCDRLNQFAHSAAQEKSRLAAVVLDVERFRIINESLGRHAGDELIRQVAARLKSTFGATDLLARTHSDCFAVMLPSAAGEAEVAKSVMQGIHACVAQPFHVAGSDLRVSIKAGISMFPNDGEQADALLRNAESALRRAKSSAEKFVFYEPRMNATAAERLSLENRLRVGIEQRQFVLHYQPKVDIATLSHTIGLEALMRWNEPGVGLVLPGKFISVLEDMGLILEAGQWALEQAVADYQRWTAMGLAPPRIAVNVSPIQLRQRDFVSTLESVTAMTGGENSGLDLEITESVIMEDIEANICKVRAAREMHLGVAIDDFGTGYSSLSYIAKLPVSTVKIDRAFIENVDKSAEDRAIVSSIISLAHSLKLRVVAEGVETRAQASTLRRLHCDDTQGFLISRALPCAEIESMLQRAGHNASAGANGRPVHTEGRRNGSGGRRVA